MILAAMLLAVTTPPEAVTGREVMPPPMTGAPASKPVDPSPEAVAAAMKIFDDEAMRGQMVGTILLAMDEGIAQEMEADETGDGPDEAMELRIRQALMEEFRDIIEAELPTYINRLATLYARHYTLDELRELDRIFDLPLFKKMIALMPTMMVDEMRYASEMLEPHQQRIQDRAEELMREWTVANAQAKARS